LVRGYFAMLAPEFALTETVISGLPEFVISPAFFRIAKAI
jgi:hypothetical protein